MLTHLTLHEHELHCKYTLTAVQQYFKFSTLLDNYFISSFCSNLYFLSYPYSRLMTFFLFKKIQANKRALQAVITTSTHYPVIIFLAFALVIMNEIPMHIDQKSILPLV